MQPISSAIRGGLYSQREVAVDLQPQGKYLGLLLARAGLRHSSVASQRRQGVSPFLRSPVDIVRRFSPPLTAAAAAASYGDRTPGSASKQPDGSNAPPPPRNSPPPPQQRQASRGPRFRIIAQDADESSDRQLPEDNPSLDDIVLDEQYYREMGITPEEVQEILRQYDATELDPEGRNLGPDGMPTMSASAEQWWTRNGELGQDELGGVMGQAMELEDDEEGEVYGPEAVLLAGFRAEEHAMVRARLDSAGGHVVKVLPVTEAMLYGIVDEALHAAEIDWSAPRPPDGPRGGGWGAQRTVLFSGLGLRAQLTLLELLESSGLPPVCAAVAREEQADRRLGEVLAEAVASQRSHASRLPRQDIWQAMPAAPPAGTSAGGTSGGSSDPVRRFTDARRGLPPLEELIGPQAIERLKAMKAEEGEEEEGQEKEQAGVADGAKVATGDVAGPARGATTAADADGVRTGGRVAPAPAGGVTGKVDEEECSWVDEEVLRPDGPALSAASLRAAEAAAAQWEAWRTRQEAAEWGEEESSLGLDPAEHEMMDLSKYGMDMERLRDQVVRQLEGMDPEALEEYLVDSPFDEEGGSGGGKPLFGWREEEEEEKEEETAGTAGSRSGAGAGAKAAAGAAGPTWNELSRVAEVQRRRWQDAQEQVETAAAAAGELVVEAESALLQSPSAPPRASQVAGVPSRHAAAAAPPTAAGPTPARRVSGAPPQPSQPPQWQQADAPSQIRPQSPPPAPPPPASDLDLDLGLGLEGFSELDDLLGQLGPGGSSGGGDSGGSGSSNIIPAFVAEPLFGRPAPSASGTRERPTQSAPRESERSTAAAVLSAASAADAARDTAQSGSSAAASNEPGGGSSNSILEQVQAAALSGAPPEVIQQMLDQLYGSAPGAPAHAAAAAPHAVTAGDEVAPAGGSSRVPLTYGAEIPDPPMLQDLSQGKRRGSLFAHLKKPSTTAVEGQQQQQRAQQGQDQSGQLPASAPPAAAEPRQRPRRSYGPTPPPEPDPVLKPLLELRPDIAKAMQERKVKFLDLSKLNDKQKRQFVEYQTRAKLERQLARQEQELEGEQQQRREQQRVQLQQEWGPQQWQQGTGAASEDSGVEGASRAAGWTGRGGEDGDYEDNYDADGEKEEAEADEAEEDSDDDDTDGDGGHTTSVSASKLRQLVAAAAEEGLGVEDVLAQAVAMGVRLRDDVLREVGLSPPSPEALQRARREYGRMFDQWTAEEGLSNPDQDEPDGDDDETGTGAATAKVGNWQGSHEWER